MNSASRFATAIVIILVASLLQGVPRALSADAGPALYPVSGIVQNDQGAPLPGIAVNGYSNTADGSSSSSDRATSAKDGSFTLYLRGGSGSLSAYDPNGSGSAYQSIDVSGDITGVKLVLPTPPARDAIVEGVARGPDGAPLAGVLVTLGQGCCYYAASGSSGSGTASSGSGTATPSSTTTDQPAPSTPPSAPDSGVVARPIRYDGGQQQATTGQDGKFHFESFAGPRQLTGALDGYATTSITVQAESGKTVTQDLKMLQVPKADAVLHGRVVDAKTGAPVPNAGVSISNLEWSQYASNTTGADGAYEMKTLPGWTQVNVYVYANVPYMLDDKAGAPVSMPVAPTTQYYNFVVSLRLVSGDNVLDIKLEPKPTGDIALVGYVVDPDAKTGVAGATVSVWNQDTGDWGSAVTDQAGSYKILVRPGHYAANAYAPDHLGGAVTFEVLDGATTKRVDIDTPAGQTRYGYGGGCCIYAPQPMEKGVVAPGAPTSSGSTTTDASNAAGGPGGATASPVGGANTSRAAAYSGSGGGLPPYSAASENTSASGAPGRTIPVGGVALGLLAFAAAAAIIARYRR